MDFRNLVLCDLFWEFNWELYKEISSLVWSFVERQSKTFTSHHRIRLYDLSWLSLNSDDFSVEMHNCEVYTCKRLKKGYLFIHIQVSSFSLKHFIWSDFNDNYDIAWLNTGNAISFSMNCKLLSVWWTLIYVNWELLFVSDNFFTLTSFASFSHVNHLSLTIALVARSCWLAVHSWAHLSQNGSHSSSFTSSTSLNSWSISSSNTVAYWADSLSLNINFNSFTIIDVGQRNLNLPGDWFNACFLLLATRSASSHKHTKDVTHIMSSCTTFKSFHTIFVVCFSLLLIIEDIVGSLNFFELSSKIIGYNSNFWLTSSGSPPLSGWFLMANFL